MNQPRTLAAAAALSTLALASASARAQEPVAFEPDVPAPMPPPPPDLKLRRGFDLALDVSDAISVRSPITKGNGVGFDARAGYRFADGAVFFAPGVDLGYVNFPKFDGAIREGIGGRLGVDLGVVEPSVYGYGGAFQNIWKSGYGVRAGAALDFRIGRHFVPGIHVDYDAARWDDNGLTYVGAGAHLGFVL